MFAFIFLATKLVKLDNKKKPWMSAIIVISCTIYTLLGLMFSAFTDGFMPQIMSLHLLLSVIFYIARKTILHKSIPTGY